MTTIETRIRLLSTSARIRLVTVFTFDSQFHDNKRRQKSLTFFECDSAFEVCAILTKIDLQIYVVVFSLIGLLRRLLHMLVRRGVGRRRRRARLVAEQNDTDVVVEWTANEEPVVVHEEQEYNIATCIYVKWCGLRDYSEPLGFVPARRFADQYLAMMI